MENKFLTRWQHKETKKIFRVTPWWECYGDIIDQPSDILADEDDEFKDRKFAVGVLAQIGYLLENEHGVWLGVGPTAKDSFDDIGVETPPRKFVDVKMKEFLDTKEFSESFGVSVQKEDGEWTLLGDSAHIFVYTDQEQCQKVIEYLKENPHFQDTPDFFLEGLDPDFQNLNRVKKEKSNG